MKTYVNLLEGKILPALSALALPIMATSFIQMAYNLTDMIWIGRIGANAVASVGAAGMFMWLSNGLATLAKMGGRKLISFSAIFVTSIFFSSMFSHYIFIIQ